MAVPVSPGASDRRDDIVRMLTQSPEGLSDAALAASLSGPDETVRTQTVNQLCRRMVADGRLERVGSRPILNRLVTPPPARRRAPSDPASTPPKARRRRTSIPSLADIPAATAARSRTTRRAASERSPAEAPPAPPPEPPAAETQPEPPAAEIPPEAAEPGTATAEPTAPEPAMAEPAVTESAVAEPAAPEPAVAEPMGAAEPAASEPVVDDPVPPVPPEALTNGAVPAYDALKAWTRAGNVQAIVAEWLTKRGATIRSASTDGQGPACDLVASLDGDDLHVEVTGWPPDGARTHPTTVAGDWFSAAEHAAVQRRRAHPRARIVIALPDTRRYRALSRDRSDALDGARAEVWFVDPGGAVYAG